MNIQTATTPPETTYAPLRWGVHALIAVSIGIISPFTGLAWPFALLVGLLLGSADARQLRGERGGFGDALGTALLAALGIIAMLIFGAIIGGLVAIAVVALASFSERTAAHASPTDRGVTRILMFMVPIVMWLVVFPLLGLNLDISIGS